MNPAGDAELFAVLATCRPDVRKGSAFPLKVTAILRLCRKLAIGGTAALNVVKSGNGFPLISQITNPKSQITNPKSQIPNPKFEITV